MVPAVGITYQTSEPIPSQGAGTTVYFQIEAINGNLESRISAMRQYALPYQVTIREIQGEAEESPYDSEIVITAGVVTATFPGFFVMQDGAGPWSGLWVQSAEAVASGDAITLWGRVDESTGLTRLTESMVLDLTPGGAIPAIEDVQTNAAAGEPYEGVLVRALDAVCTHHDLGNGVWEIDDSSGPVRVGPLGYLFDPILGSSYHVAGPVGYADAHFIIEPRDAGDVIWSGDESAPVIFDVRAENENTLRITFSEGVEETTAESAENYTIDGLSVYSAQRDDGRDDQVVLTVSAMSEGPYTLVVDAVEDLHGNAMAGVEAEFEYIDYGIPDGYYDDAAGLFGEELQSALHDIIDNHTVHDYAFLWTAFRTTDDKPNGKVWDMYSDIPGGTPPYEYTFGEDQGGAGGQEGTGYSREHSWPKSWFGGEVLPMYTDIFVVYPVDTHVNGMRGVYPYGEVEDPTWTSMNGSRIGPSSYPGYTGVVFEPIDAYKGDFARTYFYMTTRYYSEDAGWPGSPMTDGAQLRPWALAMLLEWNAADPVSQKEIERNATVYGFQGNRNPFIDRPEYVEWIFRPSSHAGEGPRIVADARLYPISPNPFRTAAQLHFSVPQAQAIHLSLCDVTGRQIAVLLSGEVESGEHTVVWDGFTVGGAPAPAGMYFARMQMGDSHAMRRLMLLR
jgi:endonuclease I